jgi:methionine sulfoxide reductase heme-binding subunit
MNEQLWWHVARATGVVAWLLAVGSVLWGLALASRAVKGRPKPAWMLDMHRHIGGLTMAFTGAHLVALVADSYVHFDLVDLLVPLASDWKPVPVALGVVALWGLVAVEVSSLAKRRLSARTWRSIHLTSYLSAAAATAHLVTAGTDALHPALRWGPTAAVSSAVFFLTYRLLVPRRRSVRASAA